MVLLYKKREFRIYGNHNEYIIHNSKKEFSEGHTHINNYKTAKWLLNSHCKTSLIAGNSL